MSQHHFSATAASGQIVQVQCGWDRPLQHQHLTVWAVPEAPAEREVLYTCLVERGGGLPDVEVLMQQRNIGINSEVLAEEVAERLGMEIDTPEGYEALVKLVKATRSIAREGLRMTSQEQGGQYALQL